MNRKVAASTLQPSVICGNTFGLTLERSHSGKLSGCCTSCTVSWAICQAFKQAVYYNIRCNPLEAVYSLWPIMYKFPNTFPVCTSLANVQLSGRVHSFICSGSLNIRLVCSRKITSFSSLNCSAGEDQPDAKTPLPVDAQGHQNCS